MNLQQQRVLQSFRRVQDFSAANPGLVPAPAGQPDTWAPLTRQLSAVSDVVVLLTTAAVEQNTQSVQATVGPTNEPLLRAAVRDQLRHVTQVARALARTVPGIGTLKMPPPGLQVESLLKAAQSTANQAATYETVLVEQGLAPDFVAQLGAAVTALRESIDRRGRARALLVSATQQVKVNLNLGQQYVSMMDAALTVALKSDSARMAEWKNAKRVTQKGVSAGSFARTLDTSPAIVPATPPAVPLEPTAKAA
ncbi:MAG: hypothetical protein ABJE47_22120 [bacterium]